MSEMASFGLCRKFPNLHEHEDKRKLCFIDRLRVTRSCCSCKFGLAGSTLGFQWVHDNAACGKGSSAVGKLAVLENPTCRDLPGSRHKRVTQCGL